MVTQTIQETEFVRITTSIPLEVYVWLCKGDPDDDPAMRAFRILEKAYDEAQS